MRERDESAVTDIRRAVAHDGAIETISQACSLEGIEGRIAPYGNQAQNSVLLLSQDTALNQCGGQGFDHFGNPGMQDQYPVLNATWLFRSLQGFQNGVQKSVSCRRSILHLHLFRNDANALKQMEFKQRRSGYRIGQYTCRHGCVVTCLIEGE